MDDVTEKRVHTKTADTTTIYVGSELGIVALQVAGDYLGDVGLVHQCHPVDLAAVEDRLAVATQEDVLVGDTEEFGSTGFGPATAVGEAGGLVAAADGGSVSRHLHDEWQLLGSCPTVTAIDGDLVGTEDGVYRLDALEYAGLNDVHDIVGGNAPLVATADGLYRLGNGWMKELDGDIRLVEAGTDGAVAHAATRDRFFQRTDGDWIPEDLPVDEPVVGVTSTSEGTYVVTEAGTLLAAVGEGWRDYPLGVNEVVGSAAPSLSGQRRPDGAG